MTAPGDIPPTPPASPVAPPRATGALPFASPEDRARAAGALAGVLAEHAVGGLDVADPRVCLPRRLAPRTTNLPAELTGAAPGTTFTGERVALLVDEGCVRWAADGPLADDLRAISWPASGT
jgi:hypothetical protein